MSTPKSLDEITISISATGHTYDGAAPDLATLHLNYAGAMAVTGEDLMAFAMRCIAIAGLLGINWEKLGLDYAQVVAEGTRAVLDDQLATLLGPASKPHRIIEEGRTPSGGYRVVCECGVEALGDHKSEAKSVFALHVEKATGG